MENVQSCGRTVLHVRYDSACVIVLLPGKPVYTSPKLKGLLSQQVEPFFAPAVKTWHRNPLKKILANLSFGPHLYSRIAINILCTTFYRKPLQAPSLGGSYINNFPLAILGCFHTPFLSAFFVYHYARSSKTAKKSIEARYTAFTLSQPEWLGGGGGGI